MQRADSPDAAAFAVEVRAFLQSNPRPSALSSRSLAHWYRLLREQGWYVPHWPRDLGGLAWPPHQCYLLQRELLAAGAPLPPGATTHLIASWLFPLLEDLDRRALVERWLAGIAGTGSPDAERWRVGVDIRRPDWPAAALSGMLDADAHWVLRPYPVQGGVDADALWAIEVCPGALIASDVGRRSQEEGVETGKLGANAPQRGFTEVELGVEPLGSPVLTGLSLVAVEALLKPVQLAWQDPVAGSFARESTARAGATMDASASWLQAPSVALGLRLTALEQVFSQDSGWQAERPRLHEGQIALAALAVLEERAAQQDPDAKAQVPGAELEAAVGQSAERLSWQLAQLEADALGYFALPAFDPQLQHNEGPIRPALYDPLDPATGKN